MINILPPRWKGLHPIARDEPQYNTRGLLVFGPLGGLIYAIATSPLREVFKRTGPGSFTKAFAHGTLLTGLSTIGASILNERALKPYLQKQGCTLKPFRIVEFSKNPWNSVVITGAALGIVLARRRTFRPLVTGWQRYVGFGSYGALTLHPLKSLYRGIAGNDMDADEELKQQQEHEQERMAWHEAYTEIYESAPDAITRWWLRNFRNPERSFQFPNDVQLEPSRPDGVQVVPSNEYSNFAPEELSESQSDNGSLLMNPPAGSLPHTMRMTRYNGTVPSPTTDYMWDAGEDSEKVIREWITALEKDRRKHSIEAEHVWVRIAQREHRLRTEPKVVDEERTDLIRELDVLCSIHGVLHHRISELDWILADSKKILLRIKGETFLPEFSTDEVRYCDPHESLIVLQLCKDLIDMQQHAFSLQNADEKIQSQLERNLAAVWKVAEEFKETQAEFEKRSKESDDR